MGCNLHEILDCEQNRVVFKKDVVGNLAAKLLTEKAPQAICFYLGTEVDIEALCDQEVFGETMSDICLPYETCWFEFKLSNGRALGLLAHSSEGREYFVFLGRDSCGWAVTECFFICRDSGLIYAGERRAGVMSLLWVLGKYIQALACCNTKTVDHVPDAKLQKARARKGKLPLFTYKTLHISVPGTIRGCIGHQGGTHASPRVHLRRGHVRRLASGKTIWIQECLVGDQSKGMVHKEYAISVLKPQAGNR